MEEGAIPTATTWMRLIIVVTLVVIGTAVVRNVTTALQDAFFGGAPIVVPSR
jgi:hypothetical protein